MYVSRIQKHTALASPSTFLSDSLILIMTNLLNKWLINFFRLFSTFCLPCCFFSSLAFHLLHFNFIFKVFHTLLKRLQKCELNLPAKNFSFLNCIKVKILHIFFSYHLVCFCHWCEAFEKINSFRFQIEKYLHFSSCRWPGVNPIEEILS